MVCLLFNTVTLYTIHLLFQSKKRGGNSRQSRTCGMQAPLILKATFDRTYRRALYYKRHSDFT